MVRVTGHVDTIVSFPGCAPAWRPNGAISWVHGARILAAPGRCVPACARVHGSLGRYTSQLHHRGRITEMAWNGDRLAVLVDRGEGVATEIDFFHRGRRVSRPEPACPGAFSHLETRATGFTVGTGIRPACALLVYSRAGRALGRVDLPAGQAYNGAVALSPDGRWVAAGSRDRLLVFRRGARTPLDALELPVRARDVAWVAPAGFG